MELIGYKQLERTRRCVLRAISEHQHCSSRDSRTVLGTKRGGNRIHWAVVKGVVAYSAWNYMPQEALSGIKIILILIYLLTAIGLSPGDSTHLHTNNT